MKLETYNWNNGTQSSPIVLTNDQIKKLISLGQNKNINTNVKGWITTSSRKMQKFLKYSLESNFPDLNIICNEELNDMFTIRAATSVIKEGTKELIVVNSDTGVTHDFLKWKYDFTDFQIEGDISEQIIKSRIRVRNGYLEIDTPKENASWSATLKLTAYPSYYKDSEFNSIPTASKPYLTFVVMAKKIDDIAININDDIPINTNIKTTIKAIPEDSTKLEGAFYTYSTTTPDIINISTSGTETEVIAKNKGRANITVTVHACNNTITKTNTIYFTVYDSLRPVTFFIDQRGSISDPDSMVSPNYIVKSNGELLFLSENGQTGDPESNVITWLRNNTHVYVGKIEDGVMNLKQLDDTDREKFADGSSSINYINGTLGNYDVWMKINSDIYYKAEASTPLNSTTKDNDYIAITIARELPVGEDETNWTKWSKNTLIGVYKMCNINNIGHSISNKKAYIANYNNIETLLSLCNANNINMSYTDINFYNLLFVLFCGYYGTTNFKGICGLGTNNRINDIVYPKITGSTNKLAGKDTNYSSGSGSSNPNTNQIIAGEGADIKTTNFWHLESIQDDVFELIRNINSINQSEITITNFDTITFDNITYSCSNIPSNVTIPTDNIATIIDNKHIILCGFGRNYVEKINVINNKVYIIGISNLNKANADTYYASYCDIRKDNIYTSYIAFGNSNKGLISLQVIQNISGKPKETGCRMQFNGTEKTVHIMDNTEIFN